MKKLLIYSLTLCLASTLFTACNDDNDELTDSRLTYYAKLEIQGDEFVEVPIGTTYKDAGAKATLNGKDYTSKIVTTGLDKINNKKAGLYYVTYTATNADGFSSSATRTVAVCDPTITTDLAGAYTVAPGTNRQFKGKTVSFSGFTINLTKAAPGIFYVSDLMGGYFDQRAGGGEDYAMKGYIQLLADNSINILTGDVKAWGDSYTGFKEGKYDPSTKTVSYVLTYIKGMEFTVILKLSNKA